MNTSTNISLRCLLVILTVTSLFGGPARRTVTNDVLKGTLVVAVPLNEGLVVCSDKRLFNDQTSTFTDTFVKIHKVGKNALFVATNTVGFVDNRTGRMAFDAFGLTANYVSKHEFSATPQFWNGLRKEIRTQLRAYFASQKFEDWPETDLQNNRLLFNLVFYATAANRSRSYTVRVFYEKARTPVINISNPISEDVRSPRLSGKGREVINYLASQPSLRSDAVVQKFDESNFRIQRTTLLDAVGFARRLFTLTSNGLPQARVSASFDCALLSYENGFQWIAGSGRAAGISSAGSREKP